VGITPANLAVLKNGRAKAVRFTTLAALCEVRPAPRLELHPRLAARLGVTDGGSVLVASRRGEVVFSATLSRDIRPDTLFAPFHWGGKSAANILTMPALDPTSRMPEFKLCAVRATAAPASQALAPAPSPGDA